MLPWGEMMRAALAAGVPVADFWALSVREWRWLSQGAEGQDMGQNGLAELMKIYPDRDENNGRI